MERKLTAKQEKFIHGVLSGLSQAEAYRRAYNAKNMSVTTIAEKSSRLASKDNIRPLIEQGKKKIADKAIWSREQALEMLRDIAKDGYQNAREKAANANGDEVEKYNAAAQNVAIKAIEQANKMCGYNAPESHNVAIGARLEDLIK